jgi:hypothetical protein
MKTRQMQSNDGAGNLKRKKTSIVVDVNLWQKFGDELRRRDLDYSEAIELIAKQAVDGSFEKMLTPLPIATQTTTTREELHELLDEIIDDGSLQLHAIEQNLEWLAFVLRVAGRFSCQELRTLRKNLRTNRRARVKQKTSKTIKRPLK